MLDTGCAKTSIDKDIYEFLMSSFNQNNHDITQSDVQVMGCTGETKTIEGTCKMRVYFSRKPPVYRDIVAMVVENLSEDVLFGYDLISSPFTQTMTKNNWIVKGNNGEPDIYIPLHKEILDLIPCHYLRTCPSTKVIPTNILRKTPLEQNPLEMAKIQHREQFLREQYPEILKKIKFGQKDQSQQNKQSYKIHSQSNKKKEIFEIKSDAEMNEQELGEENAQLVNRGFFQPSITQYIEDKSAVTELGLVDDSPLSTENFLKLFDIDHLNDRMKQLAQDIFIENKDAFSTHKYDIGKTNVLEMDIQLNSNEPKMQKYVPIPHNVKSKVRDILDQLLKYGIVRVCNEPSPYCSNILVVKKKDGETIRLLFDGRLLNYDTKRLPMALISKPEILAHLIGKKHLTSLDFADAFFHIPLSKEAQPYTAFYTETHGLRMCFTRAPQGLRNSPLYLKILLDQIFADMTDTVLFYADDLLIASDGTQEQHMEILRTVLARLTRAKLKLRPQKLLIAKERIEFLGMIFRKGNISIPEAKLAAFKNLPSPNTPKKTKSLICCLSFYRQFCPRFAELSQELMELSNQHPKTFKWLDKHEKQLRTLINEVCTNATLYLPNPAKTFYVQTDASQYCAAGRIFQKDSEGNEQIVAAVSRTFTKTERAYSIFKKEILALMYTLKSMDYFLRYATKLVIYVDAKSIIFLRLAKESSGILLRFSLELSKYNAEIFHIPGEQNQVSDLLSRQHTKIDQIISQNEIEATLSEKDSIKMVQRLSLPKGFHLTQEETKYLLEGQSPLAIKAPKINKTKAPEGKRLIKNVPDTLTAKKLNLPKTSKYRPGMNLPVNITTRTMARKEDNKMTTRAMARKTPRENMLEKAMKKKARENFSDYCQRKQHRKTKTTSEKEEETTSSEESQEEITERQHQTQEKEPNENSDDILTDLDEIEYQTLNDEFEDEDNTRIEEQIISNDIYSPPQSDAEHELLLNLSTENSEDEVIHPTQKPLKRKRKKRHKINRPVMDNEKGSQIMDTEIGNVNSEEEEINQEDEIQSQNRQTQMYIPETQANELTQRNQIQIQSEEEENDQEDNIIQYTDVKTITNIITDGTLTIQQFREAQQMDEQCNMIKENMTNKYIVVDKLLFRKNKHDMKLVLPRALYETIIFTKHFTIYGAHYSKARILRDTCKYYHIADNRFEKTLDTITKNCYTCQMYNTNCPTETIKQLPVVAAPRISWSIDMITDTPKSDKGNTQILLCVDDFTSFVVCIPVQQATTEQVLQALKTQLFAQFGIPKIIRSDQQSTFYTSKQFSEEFDKLGIQLTATAVASPFSNSRAESQIKNIKHLMRKFLFQENLIYQWDDYLPILTSSHNKSIGIYGHSAEELMFGQRNPSNIDILSIQDNYNNQEFVQKVFEKAENMRKDGRKRMEAKAKLNRSYKNKTKILKQFEIGALVLHKQLQASTGIASKYRPLYTGPYTILKINKDKCTAILEHLKTGRLIKAHFTNMQYLYYMPEINKLSDDYDKEFFDMLQDKYSLDKYKEARTQYPNHEDDI
jgi:Reverse transcriptase (RNA-dependent DNA polymerase)/RNase H-like domain found in reverse transcriptase/Integrase core domain